MIHFRKALRPLLVAVLLSLVAPATIQAADSASLATNVAEATPLNQSLLQNAGFDDVAGGASGWTVTGHVHVEPFGSKAWPTQAYGTKWSGGTRYLACEKASGQVTQTVSFDWGTRSYPLKGRLLADFGGVIGAKIRVGIRYTGDSNEDVSREAVRVLNITHHYLRAAVTLRVPLWATHIQATVELMPMDGAAKCKIVADTLNLQVFRP